MLVFVKHKFLVNYYFNLNRFCSRLVAISVLNYVENYENHDSDSSEEEFEVFSLLPNANGRYTSRIIFFGLFKTF